MIENTAVGNRGAKSTWYKVYKQRYLLLMLAPTLILITLFAYKPLYGWIIAFKDYQLGMNLWEGNWTGLNTFKQFFIDSGDAGYVFTNTLVINISCLIINLFSAMVFSILLNEMRFKFGKSLVQTFTLFPFFISWVITYSLINAFLSVNTGLVNMILMKYGIAPQGINVLGDPNYSWQLMMFVNLWKSLGYNSIIFLAAITSIDTQSYEAAEIDGAGRFKKIYHITIPGIMPTIVVLLILNSGWLLSSNFDQFYLFTNTTNIQKMQVFDMYVYRYGLQMGRFSYATAVCIVKSFISVILIICVNFISKKSTDKSIF